MLVLGNSLVSSIYNNSSIILCFVGAPASGRVRRLRRDPVRGTILEL